MTANRTLLIVVVAALLTVLAVPVTTVAAFAMEPVTGIEILHNDRISEFDEAVLEDTVVLIYDDSPEVQDPLEEEVVEDCYALILYKEEGLICKSFFITGATAVSDGDLQLAYDKAIEIRTKLDEISIGMEDILPPPDAGQDAVELPIQIGDGELPEGAQRCLYQEYAYIHSYENNKYGYIHLIVAVYYLDVGNQRLFFVDTASTLTPGASLPASEGYADTAQSKGYALTIRAKASSVGAVAPHMAYYWPQTTIPQVTITSGFSETVTLGTVSGYSGSLSTSAFGVEATGEFEVTNSATYYFSATYTEQTPLYNATYAPPEQEGLIVINGALWNYYQFYIEEQGSIVVANDVRERAITLYNGMLVETQRSTSDYNITLDIDMNWLMLTPGFLGILDEYAMVSTCTPVLTVPAID